MHNDLTPSMRSESSTLHLLKQLRALLGTHDRPKIGEELVLAALRILDAHTVILYATRSSHKGLLSIPEAWAVRGGLSSIIDTDNFDHDDYALFADPMLQVCSVSPDGISADNEGVSVRLVFSVNRGMGPQAMLDVQCDGEPGEALIESIRELLSIYSEHLALLDYAELDTLTRLHNRKTFDENFDRFISIAEQANRHDSGKRSDNKAARPCWLGVVDIDKFKRINDNFGHLFGDEVLLRLAELMRKNFRASDKLFRFGGEEFVVLLRHVTPEDAHQVFERFRQAVEVYEFPQVGQVTCSMGYMQIDPSLTPAEILGRADEALYFSKDNGRNQINRYESLVENGLIAAPAATVDNQDLQADIDALFD